MRVVAVRLIAEVNRYKQGMNEAAASTRALTGEMDKAAKAGRLDAVADSAGRMGLAFVAGVGLIANAAAKFEQQMSKVKAVTNATAGQMAELEKAAIAAGKATSFSATQAGQAQEELAKAGISTADILGGALAGSLSLAAAGSLDLAEAADIAAKTMNLFGLKGKDVTHIADVLSAAANKSATDVHEMGEALRMGGLAANAAGMSLEETVGTLSAFADRALIGSDAGTSLKTMLMMLQAPTEKSTKLMAKLGIAAYDANGNFIGTTKLAGQLQTALGGLTQEQRNAALAQIFGADAMRAANVLYEVGEKGVQKYTKAVDDQGAAARTAALKTDNLVGDIERLTGALEAAAIESGSGLNQGLRILAQAAEATVEWIGRMPPAISSTLVVLAGLVGVSLLVFAAFVKVRAAGALAAAELRNMGTAGARAADGLERSRKAAVKAAGAFIALQIASELASKLGPESAKIDELEKALAKLGKTGVATGEASRVLGSDLKDFGADLNAHRSMWAATGRTMEDVIPFWEQAFGMFNGGRSFNRAQDNIKAVDEALTNLVKNGQMDQADAAFKRILASSSQSYTELQEMLPQYSKAQFEAKVATDAAGQAQKKAAENTAILKGNLADAIKEAGGLVDIWEKLHGAMLSSDKAMLNANEAIDAVRESFKENGKAITGNTTAALKNRIAIQEAAKAAAEAAQAKFEETGSLKDANKVYDDYIRRLEESLRKEGLKPAQIKAIIDQYAKMPELVVTTVQANTSQATTALAALQLKVLGLKDKTIRVSASVYWNDAGLHVGTGTQMRRWGGVTEYAATGTLRDAAVYSAGSRPRYGFAEPETGGEAFIPKFGNAKRSLGIANTAAGWYGHTVVPSSTAGAMQVGSGSGGRSVVEHVHRVVIEGTGVVEGLRKVIELKGGDVQNALGARRR